MIKTDNQTVKFGFPASAAEDNEKVITAALGQFPLHRLLSYGVSFGDATRLLRMASRGLNWKESAIALAQSIAENSSELANIRIQLDERSLDRLAWRQAALLRIAITMSLGPDTEKQDTYLRAIKLIEDRLGRPGFPTEHWLLEDECGEKVAAWYWKCDQAEPLGVIVAQGGAEGWAMEWAEIGREFNTAGFDVVLFDGAGQGESRILWDHYFTENWASAPAAVIDRVIERFPSLPIGLLGNSQAGTKMTLMARDYPEHVQAICNNGGPPDITKIMLQNSIWMKKMLRMCPPKTDDQQGLQIFQSVVLPHTVHLEAAYLLIHGDEDVLVSNDDASRVYETITSADRTATIFEGGEHTVSLYPEDKYLLMTNWFKSVFARRHTTDEIR